MTVALMLVVYLLACVVAGGLIALLIRWVF